MLPEPALVEPALDRMLTLLLASAAVSVAPEISPLGEPLLMVPLLTALMMKSLGSISQLPVLPRGALVSMRVCLEGES